MYLDASQHATHTNRQGVFEELAQAHGVEKPVKRENSALMHLKCYEIDRRLLRTGSANFSAARKRRQNSNTPLRCGLRVVKLWSRAWDSGNKEMY
jgi:phosphatidylserine/phosphatidylglycerophosphate/cardiolipin synthase-like enzyme